MSNLKTLTDDQLVALYLEGNNKAFDELLNRHKERLYSYIHFIVRSHEVAEIFFKRPSLRPLSLCSKADTTATASFLRGSHA